MVAFSRGEPAASSDGESIVLTIDGAQYRLSRAAARELQTAVGDALVERREFLRTSGEHRADGSYVVARRGADSAGNEKVFDSFDRAVRLFDRLPATFTADDVGGTGITGSRRHMLVRHFAEHPAFDCELTARNPLTAEKSGGRERSDIGAERTETDDGRPETGDERPETDEVTTATAD